MKVELSAVIITLNEAHVIARCIESIQQFVDEIIVVDSGSNDATVKISKSFNAKTFYHPFADYASQRNWAVKHSSGKWILSVDADEVIPPDLAQEITQAIETNQYQAFLIPRKNYIFGAEIKFSRWSPDKHIWLWQKKMGNWVGKVHEELITGGKIGELKHPKLHFQDDTLIGFVKKNNYYAKQKALDLTSGNVQTSYLALTFGPITEFLIRFIYKLGFLDGWRGLLLAVIISYYNFVVWLYFLKFKLIGRES